MTKLLILGIDGADFDILEPLFEKGRLPNLERIADFGVSEPLRSTIPPSTCPGWQSFYTGKSPGNLGIYGFQNFQSNSYEPYVPDSSDTRESTYWELLGDEGLKTGIVGGPFTYPPQPIEGFMVSGPWAPSDAEVFTYPEELSEELRSVREDYVFIPEEYEEEQFKHAIDTRTDVATYLAETREWDVFTLVYRPDPLQHVYWDKDDETVFRVYEHMDERIGEVLDRIEEEEDEVNVLVMSDHGFEGVRRRYFHVNQWLEDEGWLETGSSATMSVMKYVPLEAAMNLLSKAGLLDTIKRVTPQEVKENIENPLAEIEYPETTAFFIWEQQTGQIYVNREERFPDGIVSPEEAPAVREEIRDSLVAVTDPDGRQVVEECWTREDIYAGEYEDLAPDVVFTLHREYKGQGTFGSRFTTLDPERAEGGHHVDGIFLASGPDIGTGEVEGAEIIDLAPTILHMMGAPVEEGMDGEVLDEIYAEGSPFRDREIEYVERAGGERTEADWDDAQREEVEDRLEDLGYL